MIRGFETHDVLEPEDQGRLQWGPAWSAGLIAGLVLLVVPRGSPWASLTFFTPNVVGRNVPPAMMLPLPVLWIINLGISVVYGLIIALVVSRLRSYKAVLAGGLLGFVLYLVNWGIVMVCWPGWRVDEVPVIFTHLVFGLIAAGAYRGMLRRRRPVAEAVS